MTISTAFGKFWYKCKDCCFVYYSQPTYGTAPIVQHATVGSLVHECSLALYAPPAVITGVSVGLAVLLVAMATVALVAFIVCVKQREKPICIMSDEALDPPPRSE